MIRLQKLDGTPLTDRTYKLVTSNYRATGTGGYPAIGKCPVLWRGSQEMPDLVAKYIGKHSPVGIVSNSKFVVKW